MTLYFGETLTPDYAGNWATFGGPSPSDDRNVSSIYSGVDAGLGAFTTTTAIVITELSRSFEDAIGNAGGTVSIGVLDITGGATGAILLGSATINLTAIGTGNYIWHTVSGLSISVPSGRTLAIYSGKPSLQVWSTRSGTVFSEYIAPATLILPSTWTATGSNARAVPLRAGYDLVASVSVDSYPATVRSGQTGIAYTTTGLSSVSGITVGSLAATSLSDTAGDGTHTIPSLVDTVAHQLYGTKTVTITGVGGTPTTTTSFLPPTGWDYVTLSGTLNTTTTGVLNSFSPAAVVTDQIIFETAKATVDAQGNILSDYDGTQTMWHIQASTGIARSYLVVTGAALMANWNIAKAQQYGAKLALYPQYPRPTGEVNARAMHLWAHSSMPYEMQPIAFGGCWPHRWAITSAPSGTTLGAELDRNTVGGLTLHTVGPTYQKLQLTGAKSGTLSFAYSSTDQLGTVVNYSYSSVVDDSKFVFVDSSAANDSGSGTIGSPKKYFSSVWNSGNAGKIIVLRAGTHLFAEPGNSGFVNGGPTFPGAVIGYPGETVYLDLSTHIFTDGSADGSCDDFVWRNLILINVRTDLQNTWALAHFRKQNRITFDRVYFRDLHSGTVADNNQSAITFFDPGAQSTHLSLIDCTLDPNCDVGLLIVFNANRVIAERYKADGIDQAPASNGSGLINIKAIADNVCLRGGFARGKFAGAAPGKISNQNVVGTNQEHCWYTYITDGEMAVLWNQQQNGAGGGNMFDYAGSIRTLNENGIVSLHFGGSWATPLIEGVIGYAQAGLILNESYTGWQTSAIANQSIAANEIDTTTGALTGAAVSYRLTKGSELFSTLVSESDTTPDAFSFNTPALAALGATVTSTNTTISGIDAATAVSVTGGLVSINGGAFVSSGTITNGQTIAARVTASGSYSTAVTATVNIGGVTANFTATTIAADTTPDAITFPANTNCSPGSAQSSAVRTVTGINTSTPITAVTNCTYSINGGAATGANGSVTNSQTIQLFATASNTAGATVNASVNIGGQVFSWLITTQAQESTASNSTTFGKLKGIAMPIKVSSSSRALGQSSTDKERTLSIDHAKQESYKLLLFIEKNGSATGTVELYAKLLTAKTLSLVGSVDLAAITEISVTETGGPIISVVAVPIGVTGTFDFSYTGF